MLNRKGTMLTHQLHLVLQDIPTSLVLPEQNVQIMQPPTPQWILTVIPHMQWYAMVNHAHHLLIAGTLKDMFQQLQATVNYIQDIDC